MMSLVKRPRKVVIQSRVTPESVEWLEAYAVAEQRSVSDLIRLAIEEYQNARTDDARVPAVRR